MYPATLIFPNTSYNDIGQPLDMQEYQTSNCMNIILQVKS